MAKYRNGNIPTSQLVWITSGGERFRTTRATAARWHALVADVKKHEGITLRITSGPNAYRDLAQQFAMRAKYAALGRPWQAALPGTSSHGGEYRGRDAMAIDVNNWRQLGWAKFKYYCNKHGFSVDVVSPQELWHIVDFNPFTMPHSSGESTKPAGSIKEISEEIGLDMSQIRYVHRAEKGYPLEWMIVGMEIPGGFRVTTDETTAVGFGAAYGTADGDSWKALSRKQYIKLQNTMAKLNADWVKQQKQINS